MKKLSLIFSLFFFCINLSFSQKAEWWLTTPDKSLLLAKQASLSFSTVNSSDTSNVINIDPACTYQSVDGFGFALTGGSAQHISAMSADAREKLLHELFGHGKNDIGISYLRVSIGSSDLNDHTFSYDDLPDGETDTGLKKFSLAEDEKNVIPVLKEILSINPQIKILGSPWSAPLWMKTNDNIQGGMLRKEYYPVYAQYFVRYIQGMKKEGIPIDAITVQNEPFNDGNTPSMQFLAKQELDFIKKYLGPAFEKNAITTKIILYDHNCDAPEYPISILEDTAARKYIDGSGFHLYAGSITALTKVHNAFPEKNLYFTEMMTVNLHGDFNIASPVSRIVIGATRNWSRNVILWNLAADVDFEPHTDNGGCAFCQGAVTLTKDVVERNIAYYTIAHVSKFVPAGSLRIKSSTDGALDNVAFKTPGNKTVLIISNNRSASQKPSIVYNGKEIQPVLPPGSVATFVWN